jgi:hypothetical protein
VLRGPAVAALALLLSLLTAATAHARARASSRRACRSGRGLGLQAGGQLLGDLTAHGSDQPVVDARRRNGLLG